MRSYWCSSKETDRRFEMIIQERYVEELPSDFVVKSSKRPIMIDWDLDYRDPEPQESGE